MVSLNREGRPTRVAVIGAGPAGTTTACLLARAGASVAVIDDGMRPDLIVGESLVPQLVPVFRRLGIEERVAAIGIRKPGVTVTFDAEQEIDLSFEAVRGVLPTYAYNVPRKDFDELVAATAREAGVEFVEARAEMEAEGGSGADARVRLKPETLAQVKAWGGEHPDFLIDASGRRRLFAKLLGIGAALGPRKDISHFAHYENCPWPEPAGQVMTMRLERGWGWRIPLPGPRLSIGVVMNREDIKQFGSTPEEQLETVISRDPRMGVECAGRKRVSPVATYANYQLISDTGSGPIWAMVGDAFGFVDPMLSPGLCMAMVSAERLADAIRPAGGTDPGLRARLAGYEAWFREHLVAWQSLVDYFYTGQIFAIHKTGTGLSKKLPPAVSMVIQRHIEKNLSGMASGAYTARGYSRWLLRTLRDHCMHHDPAQFAIR
jgi:flavin-dependent dehydrogenase